MQSGSRKALRVGKIKNYIFMKSKFFTGALIGLMGLVFVSCLSTEEPAGLSDLRGAKTDLLKAKTLVEQANASLVLANVATQNAITKQEEAKAAAMALDNELKKANNQAVVEQLARNKQLQDSLLKQNLLVAQTNIAKAQLDYLNAVAALDVAKKTVNQTYTNAIGSLQTQLSNAWYSVQSLQRQALYEQYTIQNIQNISMPNLIASVQTNLNTAVKDSINYSKYLADIQEIVANNATGKANKEALITTYKGKLDAANTQFTSAAKAVGDLSVTINDLVTTIQTKNALYNGVDFNPKLTVPTSLRSLFGGLGTIYLYWNDNYSSIVSGWVSMYTADGYMTWSDISYTIYKAVATPPTTPISYGSTYNLAWIKNQADADPNNTELQNFYKAAQDALQTFTTKIAAISDPIQTAITDYNTKAYVDLTNLTTDRNNVQVQINGYNQIINNLKNSIPYNYSQEISSYQSLISNAQNRIVQYKAQIAWIKAHPSDYLPNNYPQYVSLLQDDLDKNLLPAIDTQQKLIAKLTASLSALLASI
jgi:hypothetical protein